jgi:hypothetical protein
MSHKITIKTEITNQAAIEKVCNDREWLYKISGSRVAFDGGPLFGASLNMTTGAFVGDSDLHSKDAVLAFGVAYSEALWMNRIADGGYLEERTVLGDGTIRLTANVAVA